MKLSRMTWTTGLRAGSPPEWEDEAGCEMEERLAAHYADTASDIYNGPRNINWLNRGYNHGLIDYDDAEEKAREDAEEEIQCDLEEGI